MQRRAAREPFFADFSYFWSFKSTNINNNLPPQLCVSQIAAKQRGQTPPTGGCLHIIDKVSGRGGNEETAEQFTSLLVA